MLFLKIKFHLLYILQVCFQKISRSLKGRNTEKHLIVRK